MKMKILFAAVAIMMLLTSCDELGIVSSFGSDLNKLDKSLTEQSDAVTDDTDNGDEMDTVADGEAKTDQEKNTDKKTDTEQNEEALPVSYDLSWVIWRDRELMASLSESRGNAPAILIQSIEELNAFISATDNTVDLSSKHDEIKKFDDASEFDEAYFEKYSLLIVYSGEHSGSMRHRIKSLSTGNGTLSVTVENYYPSDAVTKDLTGRLLLFTFENEKIEGCDDITVDVVLNINQNADTAPVAPEPRADRKYACLSQKTGRRR